MHETDLRRLRDEADEAWREVVDSEAERILALPDPAERMRAFAHLSRVLAEEGETLPEGAADRILKSLRADPQERATDQEAASSWAAERRRLARMFVLRPIAAANCVLAAVVPFVAGAWRGGLSVSEAAGLYLDAPWGLLGVALAAVAATVAARTVARAQTIEALAWRVVASFAAGVAGLGVAVAAI